MVVQVQLIGPIKVSLPQYQTPGSAGMDLVAAIPDPITLGVLERMLVPAGIAVAIPSGYEGQIRPRSGLALKQGLSIVNSPGTIDSDYRGELSVILINLGKEPITIRPFDRIAQLVITPVVQAELELVSSLRGTTRGVGGFGSTGQA